MQQPHPPNRQLLQALFFARFGAAAADAAIATYRVKVSAFHTYSYIISYCYTYLVTQLIGDGLRPVCIPIGDTIW